MRKEIWVSSSSYPDILKMMKDSVLTIEGKGDKSEPLDQ